MQHRHTLLVALAKCTVDNSKKSKQKANNNCMKNF